MKKTFIANFRLSLYVTLLIITLTVINASFAQTASKESSLSFKAILDKVPKNTKMDFLESMCFVNGKIASAKFSGLKAVLVKSDLISLVSTFGWDRLSLDHEGYACAGKGQCVATQGYICDPAHCSDGIKGGPVNVLLKSAPPQDRQRYLNSLDFAEGRCTTADISIIEKYITKSEATQLPNSK